MTLRGCTPHCAPEGLGPKVFSAATRRGGERSSVRAISEGATRCITITTGEPSTTAIHASAQYGVGQVGGVCPRSTTPLHSPRVREDRFGAFPSAHDRLCRHIPIRSGPHQPAARSRSCPPNAERDWPCCVQSRVSKGAGCAPPRLAWHSTPNAGSSRRTGTWIRSGLCDDGVVS